MTAERAFLRELEGSCRTPIGGLAELCDGNLMMRGEMLSPDGAQRFAGERSGSPASAIRIGEELAQDLIEKAGAEFLQGLKDVT